MEQKPRHVGSLIFSLLLLTLISLALWQRQNIWDWFRLRGYVPPERVVTLADATTMDPSARRLFYINHPELDNKTEFSNHCPNFEQTIVLGCYLSTHQIYLLDVQEPRLNGVEEVTAAHEMLHAAYDRLSNSERSHVNSLLNQAFNDLKDDRIRKNIEDYRKHDASVVNSELHSILGTEVANLPAELENYYKRYFTDRAKIVSFSKQYEKTLSDQKQAVQSLISQITALKSQIDKLQAELDSEKQILDNKRQTIDTKQEVDNFNNQVADFNNKLAQLNDLIDQHNTLVEQYKIVALEQQKLFNSLDSNVQTQSEH